MAEENTERRALVAEGPEKSEAVAAWMAGLRARWPWWLLLVVVLYEISAHAVIRSRVPSESDWQAASASIREQFEENDLVVVAPDWADPLLRLHAGDLIGIDDAGRADLAPFERVWEVSLRGHRHAALRERERRPQQERRFGQITVRRYDLGPSPVVADLIDRVRTAEVTLGDRSCPWRRRRPEGAGLGSGALWPQERHQCEGGQPWHFVGETVMEDLSLRPRRCVWQHPDAGRPLRATFRGVPLGERLVVHAGLFYLHERERTQPPVRLAVELDGQPLGTLVHRDGEGWKRMELPTESDRETGDFTFTVLADDPHLRTLCWAASTRGPVRADEVEPTPGEFGSAL